MLFRWVVGLSVEDTVWNHSVFSKNRDRLIEQGAVTELLNATVKMANPRGLLSGEHFSVDGTLIQAWASSKPGRVSQRALVSEPEAGARRDRALVDRLQRGAAAQQLWADSTGIVRSPDRQTTAGAVPAPQQTQE